MSVSVKERNEVYVQRKHAVVRNKKNRATPSRVEVKSLYLIGKSNTAPMSSFRTKKCEQLSKCFVDELVCL